MLKRSLQLKYLINLHEAACSDLKSKSYKNVILDSRHHPHIKPILFRRWTTNASLLSGSSNKLPYTRNEKKNVEKRQQVDSLGTWDTTTDLPLAVKESIASGKPIPSICVTSIGVSSMKGRRVYNEDQFGFQQLTESLLYFAVFDGHGGGECAKFCANMFPKHVGHGIMHN